MCGSFVIKEDLEEVLRPYGLRTYPKGDILLEGKVRYPGKKQLLVRGKNNREVLEMHWGFSYPWAKKAIINVRCESYNKKLFASSFYYRRAIIPANGYVEWKKEGEGKGAYLFFSQENSVLSLGAIFNRFKNAQGQWEESFAILTREAVGSAKDVHHRMPLVVNGYEEDFLGETIDKETLFRIFKNDVSLNYESFS